MTAVTSMAGREVAVRLVSFVGSIILARLLDPVAFGLYAIALFVVQLCELFSRFGLGAAFVRQPGDLSVRDLAALFCPPPTYQRRQPEGSVLYRTLEANLDRFLATTAGDEGPGLPAFVTRELRAYLRCGVLEQGCLHVRCERCADEMVVGFSCKGRGFCPSCGGRRMSALAAQLVERVIPPVPVRQWTPHPLSSGNFATPLGVVECAAREHSDENRE